MELLGTEEVAGMEWRFVEAFDGGRREADGAFAELHERLGHGHSIWRYAGPGRAAALLAGLGSLETVTRPRPQDRDSSSANTERVLVVSRATGSAGLESLLRALCNGDLPPGPPQWGGAVTRDSGEARIEQPFSAYRAGGEPVRLLSEPPVLRCDLLPLALARFAHPSARIPGHHRRPEGKDSLAKRADWFRRRSGRE
jgi:hypothetical protein